jgi:thiol-disulfide isomerase/thioredoxin
MKKMRIFPGIVILLCILPLWAGAAEADWPKAITQAKLQPPFDPEALSALGLSGKSGPVSLGDINGSIIIVEIFSMYCPFCQKHAPATNTLHQAIESNQGLRGKVRLMGIGVGNTPFEVKFFKKKYGIKFPLFADGNSSIMNSLVGIKTPYYFGIRRDGKDLKVFFTRQGAFDDAQVFLKTVLDKSAQP